MRTERVLIDAANKLVRERNGPFEYWDAKTVEEKLRGVETRMREHPATEGKYPQDAWYSKQVKIDGRWLDLCRTDLCDDVRTSGAIPIMPRPPAGLENVAQVMEQYDRCFGARVTDDAIFIIDSYSDG